jgi:hypothetical protein
MHKETYYNKNCIMIHVLKFFPRFLRISLS